MRLHRDATAVRELAHHTQEVTSRHRARVAHFVHAAAPPRAAERRRRIRPTRRGARRAFYPAPRPAPYAAPYADRLCLAAVAAGRDGRFGGVGREAHAEARRARLRHVGVRVVAAELQHGRAARDRNRQRGGERCHLGAERRGGGGEREWRATHVVAVEQQLEHVGAALEASDADQVAAVTQVDDRAARRCGRGGGGGARGGGGAGGAHVRTPGDAGVAVPVERLQHEGALLAHHEPAAADAEHILDAGGRCARRVGDHLRPERRSG